MPAEPNTIIFVSVPLKVQEMVATNYQEEAVEVEMLGLVALTNRDKVFLGIDIKLPKADHIRQRWATGLLSIPIS